MLVSGSSGISNTGSETERLCFAVKDEEIDSVEEMLLEIGKFELSGNRNHILLNFASFLRPQCCSRTRY